MAMNRTQPPLSERIETFRAELDRFIDAHTAEIKKTCPGVPEGSIRNSITRGLGCQCAAVLHIIEQDEREAGAAA